MAKYYAIDMPEDIRKDIIFQLLKYIPGLTKSLSDAKARDILWTLETIVNSIGTNTHYYIKSSFSPNAGVLMKWLKANDISLYNQLTPFFTTTFKEALKDG